MDVAQAAREVRLFRADALTKIKGGFRAIYRTLKLPGKNPLKDAHASLDAAVLDGEISALLASSRDAARRTVGGSGSTSAPPVISVRLRELRDH